MIRVSGRLWLSAFLTLQGSGRLTAKDLGLFKAGWTLPPSSAGMNAHSGHRKARRDAGLDSALML